MHGYTEDTKREIINCYVAAEDDIKITSYTQVKKLEESQVKDVLSMRW